MAHRAAMIDLETLDTKSSAMILSAAVVICDLHADKFRIEDPPLVYKLVLSSQYTRTIDPETVMWWMKQSEAARSIFFATHQTSLLIFLDKLRLFLSEGKSGPVDTVWSKGSDFDLAIIEHACSTIGVQIPWSYKQKRCFRTISEFAAPKFRPPPQEIMHSAYQDAKFQLFWLYRIMEGYRNGNI